MMANFKPNLISNKIFSIKEYYEKRNKVLLIRDSGGLGDIMMMRMMFEDIKKSFLDCKLVFACPTAYFDAVSDHPYIDEIVDYEKVDLSEYVVSYNISYICGKYEMIIAPRADKHRSDIWAEHCGIKLTNHNMWVSVDENLKKSTKEKLEYYRKDETGPIVIISPKSAIGSKDLNERQINGIIKKLREQHDCLVFCLHKKKITEVDAPTLTAHSMKEFLAIVDASDYVISTDTSTLHAAGGMNKPVVCIFSWACGKVYCQYYPNHELVQLHRDFEGGLECCPCFKWGECPLERKLHQKPCITRITPEMVMKSFNKLVQRFPHKPLH